MKKISKKIFSLTLAIIMLFSCVQIIANASSDVITVGDYQYSINLGGNALPESLSIIKYNGNEEIVAIPELVDVQYSSVNYTLPVVKVLNDAFKGNLMK